MRPRFLELINELRGKVLKDIKKKTCLVTAMDKTCSQ